MVCFRYIIVYILHKGDNKDDDDDDDDNNNNNNNNNIPWDARYPFLECDSCQIFLNSYVKLNGV